MLVQLVHEQNSASARTGLLGIEKPRTRNCRITATFDPRADSFVLAEQSAGGLRPLHRATELYMLMPDVVRAHFLFCGAAWSSTADKMMEV